MRDKKGKFVKGFRSNPSGEYKKGNKPVAGFKKNHKAYLKDKTYEEVFGVEKAERIKKKIGEKSKNRVGYWKNKKRPEMLGEKNNKWKGGITLLVEKIRKCPEYKEWRLQVFGRDNYTCRACGLRGTYIEAHHIKQFSDILEEYNIKILKEALDCEELWDIDNGYTLCRECHNKRQKITLWWYNNIYKTAKIGKGTKIGSYVEIGENVEIGKDCKIQSYVFIPEGIVIEDNCFIGPRVTFTNDKNPPSSKENWLKTLVKSGARIGANVTILPGITIGEESFIGANSLIAENVPAGELWYGSPAKFIKKL